MKKKIAGILLAALMMTGAMQVNADVTVDDAASTVTIGGTVDTKQAGVRIGVDVFAPGQDYADLRSVDIDEFKRVIVLRDQVVSGENGNWEVKFEIWDDPSLEYDAKSGTYTAVIFPEDANKSYMETFSYLNLEAAAAAIEKLQDATLTDVAEMLKTDSTNLGIMYDFFQPEQANAAATLILHAKNRGNLSHDNVLDNINVIRGAVVIASTAAGRVNNLFDYAEVLGLSDTALAPYYQKGYVKNNQKAVTASLKGGSYGSFDAFFEALTEHTVLEVVKNPDGIANIREIVQLFNGRSGWKGNYSDAAYRQVQGKSYSSYEALKSALDSASVQNNGGGTSSGGYSGGGSSGGTGGAAPVGTGVALERIAGENTPQPMEYNIFSDIEEVSWAKDAILYLAQRGVVNGKEETLFYPDDTITREELVKILVLAFAPDAEAGQIDFPDAAPNQWYYPYIASAVSAEIINGYDDGTFGVGNVVTRQEMCTMVYRAAQYRGITLEGDQLEFTDEAEISDYAREAVGAMCANEIVIGVELSRFAPTESATRAQAANVVYKLLMK